MSFIALFIPAVLSVAIQYHRDKEHKWAAFTYLEKYAVAVLLNVLLTQSTIVYLLGRNWYDSTSLESFSFFTKYVFIACIFAAIAPFVLEMTTKYISVSFQVERQNED